jgi:hypothetical protein
MPGETPSGGGQRDVRPAAVASGRDTADEPVGHQLVDESAGACVAGSTFA